MTDPVGDVVRRPSPEQREWVVQRFVANLREWLERQERVSRGR